MRSKKSVTYSNEPHSRKESCLMLPQHPDFSASHDEALPKNGNEEDFHKSIGFYDGLLAKMDTIVEKKVNDISGRPEEFKGPDAFHLACLSGSLTGVQFLLDSGQIQDVNSNLCGLHGDANGMLTPLCCAVTSGNSEVVQLSIDYGADVNRESGGDLPLNYAVKREDNSACIQVLVKAGASVSVKDSKGNTPLHLAAVANDPESVAALLYFGADPSTVDASGRSSLHAAVTKDTKRASECVRILLEDGRVDINAQDFYGYTALHLSAMNKNSKCVAMLLRYGSDVTSKTADGITALSMLVRKVPNVVNHLIEKLDSGVTLHDFDPVEANCEIKMNFGVLIPSTTKTSVRRSFGGKISSRKGETSDVKDVQNIGKFVERRRKETELLTCLVSTGNKKLLAHPLSEAFLLLKWRRVRKYFLASLLFQMLLVALFTVFVVEVYLIRCPYTRHNDNESKSHTIAKRNADPEPHPHPDSASIDRGGGFHWFRVTPHKKNQKPEGSTSHVHGPPLPHSPPLPPTTPHDFSFKFSTTPGPTFPINRVAPSSAAFAPTAIKNQTNILPTSNEEAISDAFATTPEPPIQDSNGNEASEATDSKLAQQCSLDWPLYAVWLLLIVSISVLTLQEIFQLIHCPSRYVVSSENWTQWLLISSVLITAWQRSSSKSSGEHGEFELEYWQYPAAACGILIAWGLILFQVGRFPSLGLYVEMLGKVATNFGLFISAYACLLIAFALSFCVLFPEHPPFSSVPLSILKVFTMMVGEVDYEDLFYSEERSHDPILFPITAHLLFGAFVLIMTIVLMNLLVGLAVSDIQGLQKGAKLDRLCRQNALIARFESFIFSKKLETILPTTFIRVIQENSLLFGGFSTAPSAGEPQNRNLSICFRPNDSHDKSLPKYIKLAALALVTATPSSCRNRYYQSNSLETQLSTESPSTKIHDNFYLKSEQFVRKKHEKHLEGGLTRSVSSACHHDGKRSNGNYNWSNGGMNCNDYCHHDGCAISPGKLADPNYNRLEMMEAKLETLEKGIEKILEMLKSS